jgi:hypothetical protein
MLRALAIVSGLGTASILGLATVSALSVNLVTPAYAAGCNFATCKDVVILVCRNQTFVGASNIGNAEDIARIKARRAGWDPDDCTVRPR